MNFGACYCELNEYDKALEYYGKCLKIYLSKLGDNHEDTAITMYSIGLLYSF